MKRIYRDYSPAYLIVDMVYAVVVSVHMHLFIYIYIYIYIYICLVIGD